MNKTELWNVLEITFNAKTKVNGFCDAYVDVIFTHKEAGISLTMPAFWDGGYIWKVRFAPTIIGQWVYRFNEVKGTKLSIDGIIGSFEAVEYTGNYDFKVSFTDAEESFADTGNGSNNERWFFRGSL